MLKSELNKALREITVKFDELKRSIPEHILSMKMKDVRKLTSFDDIIVDEKMNNLNVTVKETVQRADEGKIYLFRLSFGALVFSFLTAFSHLLVYLNFIFLLQHTSHLRLPYRRNLLEGPRNIWF